MDHYLCGLPLDGGGGGDGFVSDGFQAFSPGMDYADWMPDWSFCSFENLVSNDSDEHDGRVIAYHEDFQAPIVSSKKQYVEAQGRNVKKTNSNSSTKDDIFGIRIGAVSSLVDEDISTRVPEVHRTTTSKSYSHHVRSEDATCAIPANELKDIGNNDMMLHFNYSDIHGFKKSEELFNPENTSAERSFCTPNKTWDRRSNFAEMPSTTSSYPEHRNHGGVSDLFSEVFPPWLENNNEQRPETSIRDQLIIDGQPMENLRLPRGVKEDQLLEHARLPFALSSDPLSKQSPSCGFDAGRRLYNCKHGTRPFASKISLYDAHQNKEAIEALLLLLYDSSKERTSSYGIFAQPDDALMVHKIIQLVSDVKAKLDHSSRLFIRDGLQLLSRTCDSEEKLGMMTRFS